MWSPKAQKLILVMVGLPARGKTSIARKLTRYLNWRGWRARVFNVGNYRRELLGAHQPHPFFDPTNPAGAAARAKVAEAALDDLLGWLKTDGDIGIYDATNHTRERRAWVRVTCEALGHQVVFIESLCDDPELIEANIRETKVSSPDYVGSDPEQAVADFRARIAHYAASYEPVDEPEASWIKVIDVGDRIVANKIRGNLPGRLVYFLMNLHLAPRRIWMSRHGESAFNPLKRIGGDPPLTARGQAYADRIGPWIDQRAGAEPLKVWTSTLHRAQSTAAGLAHHRLVIWKELDEIDAGLCDGMSYDEIAQKMPDEFAARARDKLRYRYPRGESYQDVIARLEPVILELERQRDNVVVIAHQAILRALYAYFTDQPPETCPHLPMPLHTVIELTPRTYGTEENRFKLLEDGAPETPFP